MLIKDGSELNGKVSKVLLTGSTVSHYIHVHLNITIVVHTQTKTTQKHTEKLHKIPVFFYTAVEPSYNKYIKGPTNIRTREED